MFFSSHLCINCTAGVISTFQVCINTSLQLQFQSSLNQHHWLQKTYLDFQGLSNGKLSYVSFLNPHRISLTIKMDSFLSAQQSEILNYRKESRNSRTS